MVSALVAAGFLAVIALGQPPSASNDPSQPQTKQPAPGSEGSGKKADPADAAVKSALANDPDVQVARAKVLLAEAEMAKARQAVVLKVMTLRASIEEHRSNVEAATERLAWSSRMVKSGQAPQSSVVDDRAKVESAKAALARAETELKLLTGGGKEMGMEAVSGTGDVAVQHGLLWLSKRMVDTPLDAASNSISAHALAALSLSGANKTPVGAVPDRIRAALDKQVRIGQKGETVTFEQALAVFRKEAGLDVPVRYGGRAGIPSPIKVEGEELPIGAWFQLYQDQDGNVVRLYIRDYGLLLTTKDTAPPDAPTLTEFWKQKPQAKEPKEVLDPIKKPEK